MDKIKLDFKNTIALLVFFYLAMGFADAAFISKLRNSGKFLGVSTRVWEGLRFTTGTIFGLLTLAHMTYRKDKIMLIKEYLMARAAEKMR